MRRLIVTDGMVELPRRLQTVLRLTFATGKRQKTPAGFLLSCRKAPGVNDDNSLPKTIDTDPNSFELSQNETGAHILQQSIGQYGIRTDAPPGHLPPGHMPPRTNAPSDKRPPRTDAPQDKCPP